jgi:hypothetical protein
MNKLDLKCRASFFKKVKRLKGTIWNKMLLEAGFDF